MNYLVDTDTLTRLVEPTHAMHQEALDAVTLLIRQAHNLYIVSQNLYEFWVVATRPASVNGLGIKIALHFVLTAIQTKVIKDSVRITVHDDRQPEPVCVPLQKSLLNDGFRAWLGGAKLDRHVS
jgi:hypothetical protein